MKSYATDPLSRSRLDDLDPSLREPMRNNIEITKNFLAGVGFVRSNAGRDPIFNDKHFLTYVIHDFIESATAVHMLTVEGQQRVVRRELRFVLEGAIKLCYIHQKEYHLPIDGKLERFEAILNSPRIGIKNDISLAMLSDNMKDSFSEAIGRLYGETSNYVHLTAKQLSERVNFIQSGAIPGRETAQDVDLLNDIIRRVYALSLVLLFHSVPSWVAGDWLVESNGESNPWYFGRSSYIASIDAYFDYKHERQDKLESIKSQRQQRIDF